jgi:hypothetical protein
MKDYNHPPAATTRPCRILFVLPNRFASRNILTNDIPLILAETPGVSLTLVSLFADDEPRVLAFNKKNITWRHLAKPEKGSQLPPFTRLKLALMNLVYGLVQVLLLKQGRHDALFYRFHKLHHLFIHRWWAAKRNDGTANLDGDVQKKLIDPTLAWPFPNSRGVFGLLLRLRFWQWANNPGVEAFFDKNRFDLVVFNFVQTSPIFPYVMAAKRRGIKTVGIVGSWDNPTTKGPLYPCGRYVVQNRYMADMLKKYHDVGADKVTICGWPQMDIYQRPGILAERAEFLAGMGLSPRCRLLLFGASTKRFGRHEPSVLRYLLRQMEAGVYGPEIALVIRAHPGDHGWQGRLAEFQGRERVIVEPPNYTDRVHLTNLLRHADIVMSTAGTICLDAVAFDTCAISIAFDGDEQLAAGEGSALFYQSEHYASVIETGGTRYVESFCDLDQAIRAYLHDPAQDADKRLALRALHLEPFDGKAGERLVTLLLSGSSPP